MTPIEAAHKKRIFVRRSQNDLQNVPRDLIFRKGNPLLVHIFKELSRLPSLSPLMLQMSGGCIMNYDKGTKVKKTRIFNWIFDKSHGYCANIQLPNFLFLLQHHDLGSRSKHDDHGGSKGQTLCTSQVCSKVFSYLSKQGHQLFLTLISDNEFWKQRKAIKTFAKRTGLQSDDEYNLSTCVKVSYQKKFWQKG